MPAPTPIGTEIRDAIPTIVKDPGTFGAVGNFVRNPMLMAGAPRMKTSPSMSNRGITARTTVTIINTVINLLRIFRQSEIPVGRVEFFIASTPFSS